MAYVPPESNGFSDQMLDPITVDKVQELLKSYDNGIRIPYKAEGHQLFLPSSGITVVAAGTGVGKTTFLLNLLCECLALNVSQERFYFVSYEEPAFLLAVKILMILSNHSFDDEDNFNRFVAYFRHHGLCATEDTPKDLQSALETFQKWINEELLYICDPEVTVDMLTAAMQKQNQCAEVGAVFIDYIQRVRIDGYHQHRYLEVKEISSVHDNFELRRSPMKNGSCEKPLQRRAHEAYRVDGEVKSERFEAAPIAA